MSVKMTARVWALQDDELEGARLLTLLSLADYANGDDQCWASVPTIAKKTRISDRQVQRSIQWLESRGYIQIVEKGNGRGRLTTYLLLLKGDIIDVMGDTMTPFSDHSATVGSIKGDICDIKGDIDEPIQSYARREPIQQPTTEGEKEIAADAAPPAPATLPVKEKPKRSRKSQTPPSSEAPPREPTEWQEYLLAFCWLCHGHVDINSLTEKQRGALTAEAKVVKGKGYTLEQLKKWYTEHWKLGWQWKKNNGRPQPSDIRSGIAVIRGEKPKGFEETEPAIVLANPSSNAANNRTAVTNVFSKLRAAQGVNGHG